MIRRLISGFLTAGYFFILGCGEATATRVVAVEDCSALRVQGAFHITLQPLNGIHIDINGTRQAVDAADIDVLDGVVSITSSLPSELTSELTVQVSCPDLRRLELIGAVQAEQIVGDHPARYEKVGVYGESQFAAQQLSAVGIDIRGSGSAQIAIERLVAEHTQLLLLSGASQTVVEGETSELIAEVTGRAALAAEGLQAQTVRVKAGGDSRTTILATAHLTANLRDTAHVSYAGTPDLVVDASELATFEQVSR